MIFSLGNSGIKWWPSTVFADLPYRESQITPNNRRQLRAAMAEEGHVLVQEVSVDPIFLGIVYFQKYSLMPT